MDIIEKAKEYAEEKALKGINSLIEQAYLDGYNDGLKHYENEKLESIKNGVEYVDLGLKSGTLWSSKCLKNDINLIRKLPYCEASKLCIPTKEQYFELFSECHHSFVYDEVRIRDVIGLEFTGKKGKSIIIEYASIDKSDKSKDLVFWLRDENDSNDRMYACKRLENREFKAHVDHIYMGLELPVMLVMIK